MIETTIGDKWELKHENKFVNWMIEKLNIISSVSSELLFRLPLCTHDEFGIKNKLSVAEKSEWKQMRSETDLSFISLDTKDFMRLNAFPAHSSNK